CGAAYLPLDPDYPTERLRFMLEDAAPRIVLTSISVRERLPQAAHLLVLDEPETVAELQTYATRAPTDAERVAALHPHHPAYVIYTSGSTGTPKGVVNTHRNVVRLFETTRATFDFSASDTWTLFHSYAFDFSVWEIWGALLHGARLVIVPRWVARSPEAFRELLVREKVTVLNQTPSAFYRLMQADEEVGDGAGAV